MSHSDLFVCILFVLVHCHFSAGYVVVVVTPGEYKNLKGNHHRNDIFVCAAAKKGYVPSGLTEEEYREIKQKEANDLSKKNFGAFGPRFLQTERPDGDWMLVPSLWTKGFNANNSSQNIVDEISETDTKAKLLSSSIQKLGQQIRHRSPILLTSFILMEVIFTMIGVATKRSSKMSLLLSLATLSENAKLFQLWIGNPFVQLTKVIGTAVLYKPLANVIELANRRWLWSHRRTMVTLISGAFSFLAIWVGIFRLLGKFP